MKLCNQLWVVFLSGLLFSITVCAQDRADSHAPIGVMGEHIHAKGEWMLSYRYMKMDMKGNRDGSDRVGVDQILRGPGRTGQYGVAPLEMDMEMHMLGAMYAPTDRLTLMTMVPVIELSMDHQTAMDTQFETESDGLGDIKLSGIYQLSSQDGKQWLLNIGLSLPSGSIDEKDFLPPVGRTDVLPFPMQIGSGTVDLLPGVTYTVAQNRHSWGLQARAVVRTGENDSDYTLGDRLQFTSWYARPFAETWSWSVRINYEDWDDIDGVDSKGGIPVSNMIGLTVPTVDPTLRAGSRLDIGFGLNYIIPGDVTNRIAFEILRPVQQDLDGPQLEVDSILNLGWQLSF